MWEPIETIKDYYYYTIKYIPESTDSLKATDYKHLFEVWVNFKVIIFSNFA